MRTQKRGEGDEFKKKSQDQLNRCADFRQNATTLHKKNRPAQVGKQGHLLPSGVTLFILLQ